jgi:hypothetical protein
MGDEKIFRRRNRFRLLVNMEMPAAGVGAYCQALCGTSFDPEYVYVRRGQLFLNWYFL